MFKAPEQIHNYIKSVITAFECSLERRMIRLGNAYYESDNVKIMERKKLMYVRDSGGGDHLMEDPYKANNKLASGFYKLLIDQKIQYSIGKTITLKSNKQDITGQLGKQFMKVLRKAGKDASKKYIGWVQPYVNQNGEFKLMHIPSEQLIPVYKSDDVEELELAFRYYPVPVQNKKGDVVEVSRVEVWDEKQVTYFQEDPDTKLYSLLVQEGFANPRPHMKAITTYGEEVTKEEALSWGQVPFIPFYNNDENLCDLKPIKNYIDVYDFVESDFANNLEDIQDVYWILKGYNGENLETFLSEVRKYKALKVSEEGDAHAESVQIPADAREKMLDRLNDDIFKFGRGVDTTKTGDGNLTNVVIKARFANLDLKANEFEAQCSEFIDRVVWFVNRYNETKTQEKILDYDVTYNRSQIINENEMLTANAAQQGVISEDTRLANHPWVSDVEEEKARMEAEKPEIKLEDNPDDGQGKGSTGPDGATV